MISYSDWLKYVFDHEVTKKHWSFGINAPDMQLLPDEVADLVIATFENSGKDLQKYSDGQVNQGIDFIINNSLSDYSLDIVGSNISADKKRTVVRSVYTLYRDCFAKRCTETLSNIDEKGNVLNEICYMFWDVSPLQCTKYNPSENDLKDTNLKVYVETLTIPHRACREGALHGLGHSILDYESEVHEIIDAFLRENQIDEKLQEYALRARTGMIN